jgi:hypothetical protein
VHKVTPHNTPHKKIPHKRTLQKTTSPKKTVCRSGCSQKAACSVDRHLFSQFSRQTRKHSCRLKLYGIIGGHAVLEWQQRSARHFQDLGVVSDFGWVACLALQFHH